jgi:hypothetical protein
MPRVLFALAVVALTGCVDPNAIGVQQYGTIAGNVYNLKSQPIGGALISVGSTCTTYSAPNGSYTIAQGAGCPGGVPIGTQVLNAQANGYQPFSQPVAVTQGNVAIVQIQMQPVGN